MSDDFAERMKEFGQRLGMNRAERRRMGLTKAKARKMGFLAPPEPQAPPKQTQIKKPKKGRP